MRLVSILCIQPLFPLEIICQWKSESAGFGTLYWILAANLSFFFGGGGGRERSWAFLGIYALSTCLRFLPLDFPFLHCASPNHHPGFLYLKKIHFTYGISTKTHIIVKFGIANKTIKSANTKNRQNIFSDLWHSITTMNKGRKTLTEFEASYKPLHKALFEVGVNLFSISLLHKFKSLHFTYSLDNKTEHFISTKRFVLLLFHTFWDHHQ